MDAASTATLKSNGRSQVKHKASVTLFFSLLLMAFGKMLSTQKQTMATPPAKSLDNSCIHIGRIISIQGEVQMRRIGWGSYHPIANGASLCEGDLLQPTEGTKAIVQCADIAQNLWILPDDELSSVNSGCRPPKKPIYSISVPITPTRDPFARRPYIITPNNTWVLNNQPVLRWLAVPGATSYVVRVSGLGVDWKQEVNTTKVVYPGQPPLKPAGEGYLIKVEANNGSLAAKATFSLVAPTQVAQVRSAIERLNREKLSDDAKTLALSEIYITQGLIAEATERLEAAVANGSQTAAIYYTLGNLYSHVELFEPALKQFLKASKLSANTRDIEGQAIVEARLGEVYQVMGERDKAAYWLKKAQAKNQALLSLQPVSY